MSRVGVYKCLLLIVGFAVTVAIRPREVVSCRDFLLRAVATFWAMLLVGIYPGRASLGVLNCSLKNVGLRKFRPDLEILEAFTMGLVDSFLGDFVSHRLKFF